MTGAPADPHYDKHKNDSVVTLKFLIYIQFLWFYLFSQGGGGLNNTAFHYFLL